MTDSKVKLEQAETQDIYEMQYLWQSIAGLGIGYGDDEESLNAFIKHNPTTCLLLKDAEQIIGTVLGGFDGRRGYIYHLAVHPGYQQKGYGKLLLSQVTSRLKALGAMKIHLFVYRSNNYAINFYLDHHWQLRNDIQVLSWEDPKIAF